MLHCLSTAHAVLLLKRLFPRNIILTLLSVCTFRIVGDGPRDVPENHDYVYEDYNPYEEVRAYYIAVDLKA